MHKEVENAYRLYSENEEEVMQALYEKKDWILSSFYVKGNIDTILDRRGRTHYPFIEALLDDVLLFSPITFTNEIQNQEERLQSWNERFQILDVYEQEPKDAPFVAVYDFTLLDRQAYNALMPNFYHGLEETLEDEKTDDILDLLRLLFQKEKGNSFLLLDKSALLNQAFFAPVLTKIIAFPSASEELKEELLSIASEKNIPYEEREMH